MASAGHRMTEDTRDIEARIKTLVNGVLKDICRTYGYPVSGTKALLQSRCNDILRKLVASGDPDKLDAFRYRVNNLNNDPPPKGSRIPMPAELYSASFGRSSTSATRVPSGSTQSRLPSNINYFRPSPFYEVQETLLPLHDLPGENCPGVDPQDFEACTKMADQDMPQNRHTVKASLAIKPDTAISLRNDGSLKIMLYCGAAHSMTAKPECDITFPGQIEVKINDTDVKANFKGLKNKPGSTKPVDVTAFIRKYSNQPNAINVTYALTNKRYAFVIYLVRYRTPAQLTEQIKSGHTIPKHQVLDEMRRANADPDIAATSIHMSLKDPVSTMRIAVPIRSTICKHNQCFDAACFMQLQDQAPQWQCPICNKSVSFSSLCIDKYFEDILNNTPKSIERVVIEPSGEWQVIKEEDEQNENSSRKRRAPYDEDSETELVELDTPPRAKAPTNGYSQPLSGQSFRDPAICTPPVSSRETSLAQSMAVSSRRSEKRAAAAVIDLTASDDEDDEPPRPAKRQHLGNHISGVNTGWSGTSNNLQFLDFAALADQYSGGGNSSILPTNQTIAIPSRGINSQSPQSSSFINGSMNYRASPFSAPVPASWALQNSNSFSHQPTFGQSSMPAQSQQQSQHGPQQHQYDMNGSPINGMHDANHWLPSLQDSISPASLSNGFHSPTATRDGMGPNDYHM